MKECNSFWRFLHHKFSRSNHLGNNIFFPKQMHGMHLLTILDKLLFILFLESYFGIVYLTNVKNPLANLTSQYLRLPQQVHWVKYFQRPVVLLYIFVQKNFKSPHWNSINSWQLYPTHPLTIWLTSMQEIMLFLPVDT